MFKMSMLYSWQNRHHYQYIDLDGCNFYKSFAQVCPLYGEYFNTLVLLSKQSEECKLHTTLNCFKKIWINYSCSNNTTSHTNLPSFSHINTAPIPTVLSTDLPTHMQLGFISVKWVFGQEHIIYYLQKPLKNTCLNYTNLWCYMALVTAFCLMFCLRQT